MRPQPSIALIVRAVSGHYSVPEIGIISMRMSRELIEPRFVACYLASRLTTHSLTTIGRSIGGRDHSTIRHAIGRVAEARLQDFDFQAEVEALAVEILAEAQTLHVLGMPMVPDIDPLGIAQAVMSGRRSPAGLSTMETLALAAAVTAQIPESSETEKVAA